MKGISYQLFIWGFPGGSEGKTSACNAGDLGLIPGLGRSPGEGNGNPLPYSCLENPMDGGAWQAAVHGVTKSRTQVSDSTVFLSEHIPGVSRPSAGSVRPPGNPGQGGRLRAVSTWSRAGQGLFLS